LYTLVPNFITLLYIYIYILYISITAAGVAAEIDEARVRRDGGGGHGVTGPVHTFVKTDKHAHFKWGVRHHVGHQYAG
jgi:hypothetical protein